MLFFPGDGTQRGSGNISTLLALTMAALSCPHYPESVNGVSVTFCASFDAKVTAEGRNLAIQKHLRFEKQLPPPHTHSSLTHTQRLFHVPHTVPPTFSSVTTSRLDLTSSPIRAFCSFTMLVSSCTRAPDSRSLC